MQLKDQQLLQAPSQGLHRETSTASSISRSTDALLAGVSAALKRVPVATYTDQEVRAVLALFSACYRITS